MVTVDLAAVDTPADVTDPLLWRDAQFMLERHARPDERGLCVWCGRAWSCAPRRLAERAAAAARKPWREAWTARHDIAGMRALPEWRRAEPASGHLPPANGVITSNPANTSSHTAPLTLSASNAPVTPATPDAKRNRPSPHFR